MSAKIVDDRSKVAAVGEALAGFDTLSSIARRHGISIGYLSVLTSRARRAVESKTISTSASLEADREKASIRRLTERVYHLEKKFNRLFK